MAHIQPNTHLPKEPAIKTYSVLIQQFGTGEPSTIPLYNTLLTTPFTWERLGTGSYRATTTGDLLEITKTSITFPNITNGIGSIARVDDNTIQIDTYDLAGVPTDSLLNYNYLEIQVYTNIINNVIT